MSPFIYSDLLEKAMRVSARAHHLQTRKASDLPYLVHPTAVALILSQAGYGEDEEVLAAALLHDVVEDTPVTLEELDLEHSFPPGITKLVEELSEQKEDEAGKKRMWKQRKLHHIEVIRASSDSACAIVLADKLHNLKSTRLDLKYEGPSVWDRFHASVEQVFWYHQEMLKAANRPDDRIQFLITENQKVLDDLMTAHDAE